MHITQKGRRRQREFRYCVVKSRMTKAGTIDNEVVGTFLREQDAQKWVLAEVQRVHTPSTRAAFYVVTKMLDPYAKHAKKVDRTEEVSS